MRPGESVESLKDLSAAPDHPPEEAPQAPEGPAGGRPPPPKENAAPPSFLFTHRNLLGISICVFLIGFPFWRMPLNAWLFAVGSGIVLAGLALRLWAIRQIGGSARKTSRPKAVRIISWGPFGLVRNPIYIANGMFAAGFTVLSGHLWALPLILLALWIWYDAIVRREEKFLEAAFPADYAEYKRTTNRWIPKLRFRKRPPEIPVYSFFRVIKRERGLLFIVPSGMVLVIVLRFLLF